MCHMQIEESDAENVTQLAKGILIHKSEYAYIARNVANILDTSSAI